MSAFEDALLIAENALRRNYKANGLPRKRVTKESVARFLMECGIIIVRDESGISRMVSADEPLSVPAPLVPFQETQEESGHERANQDIREARERKDSMDSVASQISAQ